MRQFDLKREINAFLNDESGVGVIEIVLVLVVLIGLVILFRNSITKVMNSILTQIESQASKVYTN